jgi:hypothetical protein
MFKRKLTAIGTRRREIGHSNNLVIAYMSLGPANQPV